MSNQSLLTVVIVGLIAAETSLAGRHDVDESNNPVAIMVEKADWIEDLLEEEELRSGENLEEFKRALHQIRNQGKRCKEITHKLLSSPV